jgi:hypothetical protein
VLLVFYDIHGRKGKVLFFYSVSDTTRDTTTITHIIITNQANDPGWSNLVEGKCLYDKQEHYVPKVIKEH